MDITTTLAGNLVEDPELRVTSGGRSVGNVRLAHTPRRYDRATDRWVDGDTTYLSGSLRGAAAEHVAESLRRGDRVLVTGRLRQRDFATAAGEKRSILELDIEEIGVSLRYATAAPRKTAGAGAGGDGDGGGDGSSR